MNTDCTQESFKFQGLARRQVEAGFDGGQISSDTGALLLRETDLATDILRRFAACFRDHRDPHFIEHTVLELVSQRVYGIALGYEDINDHDRLRDDPIFATLVGKADPSGASRLRERDRGSALAGKSTLNRLELAAKHVPDDARYHKITYEADAIDKLLIDLFIEAQETPPEKIIIDLDPTDFAIHGNQEGKFYHGYYRNHCYLPLYGFAGKHLLCARLRQSDIDGSAGTVEELKPLITKLRAAFPDARIIVRGDSAFAREQIMSWCEAEDNEVDYIFGLAQNPRLTVRIAQQAEHARRRYFKTGKAARSFRNFSYRTKKSWSRHRRVVGKAEHLAKGANPRFVVTSLSRAEYPTRALYEELYCARGEMENRIKEQQLDLFANRVSSHTMRANQLRLYFAGIAYVLVDTLRRIALADTELANARCSTIRLKLFKIGAQVKVSVRRVYAAMSCAYPLQELFEQALHNIRCYSRPLRV